MHVRMYVCMYAFTYVRMYHMGGNFRGMLDFVGSTQTTKNSLKISVDPRK